MVVVNGNLVMVVVNGSGQLLVVVVVALYTVNDR